LTIAISSDIVGLKFAQEEFKNECGPNYRLRGDGDSFGFMDLAGLQNTPAKKGGMIMRYLLTLILLAGCSIPGEPIKKGPCDAECFRGLKERTAQQEIGRQHPFNPPDPWRAGYIYLK